MVHYLHDEEGARVAQNRVQAQGRRAIVVQGDHGYEDQVERMFRGAFDAFGRVDSLMNNASVDASGTYVADLEIVDFEATLRSNLIGQLICCKHFINHRKQAGGGGRIINTTSVHQEQPRAGAADCDCSKGPLRNLTRTLVLEVPDMGITVNNIAPGMVLTPFNQQGIDDPAFLEEGGAEHPAQGRRTARERRPAGRVPRLQRGRLRHRHQLGHGWRADADGRPGP